MAGAGKKVGEAALNVASNPIFSYVFLGLIAIVALVYLLPLIFSKAIPNIYNSLKGFLGGTVGSDVSKLGSGAAKAVYSIAGNPNQDASQRSVKDTLVGAAAGAPQGDRGLSDIVDLLSFKNPFTTVYKTPLK